MVEQNQEVTVRQLPDGTAWPVRRLDQELPVLRLWLTDAVVPASFRIGSAVEVHTAVTLYLGEVQALANDVMLVGVEHFLNWADLEEIQRIWGQEQRG